MKFVAVESEGRRGLAVETAPHRLHGLFEDEAGHPGRLETLLIAGADAFAHAGAALAAGPEIDAGAVSILPPLPSPGKMLCVGLNYRDHAAESNVEPPAIPTIFARYASSLIGHDQPLVVREVQAVITE